MCAALSKSRFQKLQSQGLQMDQERLPVRGSEGTLTTTLQVLNQPPQHITIRAVENPPWIAIRKVAAPTRQVPAHVSYQVIDRHQTLATGCQFPHTIAEAAQRTLRGKHVEVSPTATEEVAVEAKSVAQKIHVLSRWLLQIDRPRLPRPVDGQAKAPLQLRFHPNN